jgi:putative methionine-R-sulfoxide reductase with GAF domain
MNTSLSPMRMLLNMPIVWKIRLVLFSLTLAVAGIATVFYFGAQSLRVQIGNIYDFMLVPIVAINQAEGALADSRVDVLRVHNGELTNAEIQELALQIEARERFVAEVIQRYESEWVTTTSADFTQSLREAGKLDLQEKEVAVLADLRTDLATSQQATLLFLNSIKRGENDSELAHETIETLEATEIHLETLIEINNEFAGFSNSLAQNAYRNTVLYGSLALVLGGALGLALSSLIANSITSRLSDLTNGTEQIQAGNFNSLNVPGSDEIGRLSAAFDAVTMRLQSTFEDLHKRNLAIQTSAEVSQRLSVAATPQQLALDVVEQVQNAFRYYHAHIYFIEETTGDLVMAGGTGEAGAVMLARRHRVQKGSGLVGRAAESNTPILVEDVTQSADWLPNPLLPETKSEAAIPIASGANVLGVLDVQQNKVQGLQKEDVIVLQSLASQVAISLQNARTLEKTQAKARLESSVNTINRKIQQAVSMEEALQVAMSELRNALGAQRIQVQVSGSKETVEQG